MTDEAMSPLRRRMIEDMTIRHFAPKTQHDYLQRVKNFAAFHRAIPRHSELRRRAPLSAVRIPDEAAHDSGMMPPAVPI
jgi:hypothetical protein